MTPVDQQETNEPGWFQDPWGAYAWRWWDGHAWTANVSLSRKAQPKLPAWLSVPVCAGSLVTIPLATAFLLSSPIGVFFSFTPLAVLFPGLWWLNRIEPQPWESRVHAFLWGAMVATLLSLVGNSFTSLFIGFDVAVIASAPIVEEATKGLAIVWAVRRKEVDGVMDGVIIGCWSALGFAVFENMLYFAAEPNLGSLALTIFLRGVLSPFAHPLFTFWMGLAVGLSVRWQQSLKLHLLWGYPLAVVGHAGWNGTLTYATEVENDNIVWFGYAGYLVVFTLVLLGLFVVRINQQQMFVQQIPLLSSRYVISKKEIEVFGDWRTLLATRRSLTSNQTANFDRLHAALAKLALAHGGPAKVSRAQEELLASQLQIARSRAFANASNDDIDQFELTGTSF